MIFNSITFIIFFGIIIALYWLLPRGPRIWFLVLSSMIFYGFWDFRFVPLLLLSIVLDYLAGRYMSVKSDSRKRNLIMVSAVSVNLIVLGFFKYLIFFVGQINGLAQIIGVSSDVDSFSIPFQIILPLGISFYTFQSMSYTIDVWRRNIKAEHEFKIFAAYVIFFPQLVAGPILRAGEVMWQLDRRPRFDWNNLADGLNRIIIGLFLKVFLADNIATLVNTGFAISPSHLGGLDVLTLSFLFGFQIYFDFAGYSHIAIGCAKMMGINFPENFNFPYLARNPRQFWERWHISLSSWIRDYLYLPLCGERSKKSSLYGLQVAILQSNGSSIKRINALWLTWLLMGFWHGASWTFALWGIWHAGLITVYRIANKRISIEIPAPITWGLTLVAVMVGWIPFRASSLGNALDLWGRLFSLTAWLKPEHLGGRFPFWLGMHRDSYYVAGAVLLAIICSWCIKTYLGPKIEAHPVIKTFCEMVTFLTILPIVYLFLRPTSQFIYFQF
jgi:alginate O-acetyltransferase complex protein AlgI